VLMVAKAHTTDRDRDLTQRGWALRRVPGGTTHAEAVAIKLWEQRVAGGGA